MPASLEWFIRRLAIDPKDGPRTTLRTLHPEQRAFLRAWNRKRRICVLKPRQMGFTTVATACVFHAVYTSPDPIRALQMAHEKIAATNMNTMLKTYLEELPRVYPRHTLADNTSFIKYAHNKASIRQHWAGGRGQGRSSTFQLFHATEMAFWPSGTAAARGSGEADKDVWQSVMATMKRGRGRVIVESTGDGAHGQFFEIVKRARRSSERDGEWAFLFFPWSGFAEYRMPVPKDFERTYDERKLAEEYQLDDEQLVWRRFLMDEEGFTERRFRREYPLDWMDPFRESAHTWFNSDIVTALSARLPEAWHADRFLDRLRVYLEPDPHRDYFIGVDTAGGSGARYSDDAAIVVLRDDFEVVAVWSANDVAPHGQAEMGAKLSAMYNNALVLCEANKYGLEVITQMEDLGVPTWKGKGGRNWTTLGGPAGQTKLSMYSYGRHLLNDQICCSTSRSRRARINDSVLIDQLGVIREDEKGQIGAPEGMHDDVVTAWLLALWCGRHRWPHEVESPTYDPERVRIERIRSLDF